MHFVGLQGEEDLGIHRNRSLLNNPESSTPQIRRLDHVMKQVFSYK